MLSETRLGLTRRTESERFVIAGQELLLREVDLSDRASVLELHQQVFGTKVDERWFDWKYRQGLGEAVGIWCDDELITLCGGVSRQFFHFGAPVFDLQLADVMVTPRWRGVLTRKSPFFRASERFYTSRIGAGRPFKVGFGFGNTRHVRLAVKLGIGWNSGEVAELGWTVAAAPAATPWLWSFGELSASAGEFDDFVERAWQRMQREGGSRYWLGLRDAAYARWRFVDRPDLSYRFLRVSRPWRSSPEAIAVVRMPTAEHPRLQWIDWIGPASLLPVGWRLCMAEAQRIGATGLSMWASASVEAQLASVAVAQRSVAALLGIPKMSSLDGQDVMTLPWWFMAGDTDFM